MTEEKSTVDPTMNRLAEDFASVYANNSRFELSTWDLKIFFGQLSQFPEEKPYIDWHTAITLPWMQAKILSYFLQVNLAGYEAQNGKIRLPANIQPPVPPAPTLETENEQYTQAVHELILKLHHDMFGA